MRDQPDSQVQLVVDTEILQSTGVEASRATLAGHGNIYRIGRIGQPGEMAEAIGFLILNCDLLLL